MNNLFHLAIPINDLRKAKHFYCSGLGSELGRENDQALILNFFGHQLVAHMTKEPLTPQKGIYPRHFGLVFLELAQWQHLLERAKLHQLEFLIQPKIRFPEQLTEHYTFFLEDPFYNLLEFKHYTHYEAIFGAQSLTEIGDR